MFAITGATGRVGGATARALLDAGVAVRVVVRDRSKGAVWARCGCDVALADFADEAALAAAFRGAEGVFVMLPPMLDPTPGYHEAQAFVAAARAAILTARPGKVVCLSSIGAQATRPSLLNVLGHLEQSLGDLPMPVGFLRAAWFLENAEWDLAGAKAGRVRSFLQPLDRPVPMVATSDVGRRAAAMLREDWTGRRVVELEGPRRVTPNDVAAAFAVALGREVRAEAVPRDAWEELFAAAGARNPTPRAQMMDGFNEGWIAFEGGADKVVKGDTPVEEVVGQLVRRAAGPPE